MFMIHFNGLFMCVCMCEKKKVLLWSDILRCDCIYDGGNVLCCRDAANIKGGLEHLVSSIWHPPFTPKRTHAPTHTLMHVMLFDICIPNETSGMGAEYLQLTGRQRGRKRWLREGSGSSRVLSIFNISFSFIPNPALTRRLFTLFSLSCRLFFYVYVPVCWWMYERRLFSPSSSLPASVGPALRLPP